MVPLPSLCSPVHPGGWLAGSSPELRVAQARCLGLPLDPPSLLQPCLVLQEVAGWPLNCSGVYFLDLSHHPPSPELHAATLMSPEHARPVCTLGPVCLRSPLPMCYPPGILDTPSPLSRASLNISFSPFFSPQLTTLSHARNSLVCCFSVSSARTVRLCCLPPWSLAQARHTVGPRETSTILHFRGLGLGADLQSCRLWLGLLSIPVSANHPPPGLPHIQSSPASSTTCWEP